MMKTVTSVLIVAFSLFLLSTYAQGLIIQKIAFGSCSHEDKKQPLLSLAAKESPDLFIYLGDNIYGDTEDMAELMTKYIKLGNKPEFQELINEWEPSDDSVEELILTKVKKIISAEFDAIGLNSGFSVSDGFDTYFIIQDIENECTIDKSWEKISQDDEIYKSDNVSSYLVKDEDSFKKFKKDYERFVIYRNIIESYNLAFQSWYSTIENEGTDVLKNMDNENEIFWKELRLKIEKWQLNFLKQDAHRSFALGKLDKIHHYISIDNKNKVEWIKSADKAKNTMYRQIDEIKYQLENLATPGHTHDEQSLQFETEKTNERILLLSFLALSIPMLNAILSPDFTLLTKIISSIVLLSLPLFYFSTIRFVKRRIKNINRKRDMIRRKDHYLQGLERDKCDLEQIQNDKKMSIDSKNVALDMINLNIDFKEKFIQISRDIYFANDRRSKIKFEINKILGSNIKEVKQYTEY